MSPAGKYVVCGSKKQLVKFSSGTACSQRNLGPLEVMITLYPKVPHRIFSGNPWFSLVHAGLPFLLDKGWL